MVVEDSRRSRSRSQFAVRGDLSLVGPTKRGIAVEAVLIIKLSERLANEMSALGHLRMWAEINRDVGLVPTADISFWKAQKALRWR